MDRKEVIIRLCDAFISEKVVLERQGDSSPVLIADLLSEKTKEAYENAVDAMGDRAKAKWRGAEWQTFWMTVKIFWWIRLEGITIIRRAAELAMSGDRDLVYSHRTLKEAVLFMVEQKMQDDGYFV